MRVVTKGDLMDMTERIGNAVIIAQEAEQKCHFCGRVAECRPYGPGNKQICFECAMSPKYKGIVEKNTRDAICGPKSIIKIHIEIDTEKYAQTTGILITNGRDFLNKILATFLHDGKKAEDYGLKMTVEQRSE